MERIPTRAKTLAVAAVLALVMLSASAGSRIALAGVAEGESAFKKGDFTTAMRAFEGPAYRGNAVARYYLGVIFADALGVPRDDEEALAWMICVGKGAGLPAALGPKMQRTQSRVLSRISPYTLEQAQMRAEAICGIPTQTEPEPFAEKKRNPEDIRPPRSVLGGMFFFPGDTMTTGAAVVFHELGLTFLENMLFGIAGLFGDFFFGILSLIGWYMMGRIIYFFGEPVWQVILARNTSARTAARAQGGPRESEQN